MADKAYTSKLWFEAKIFIQEHSKDITNSTTNNYLWFKFDGFESYNGSITDELMRSFQGICFDVNYGLYSLTAMV